MGKLFKAIRYSSLGVFFTGIFTVIQGCDAKEGALAAVLLVLLQFCSGPVDTTDTSVDLQLIFGPGGASVSSIITFTVNSPNRSSEELSALFWDFGDGTTASGSTVTHSYAAAGDYLVTVSLSTSNSFTASAVAQQIVGFIISRTVVIISREEMLQLLLEQRPIYVVGQFDCIVRVFRSFTGALAIFPDTQALLGEPDIDSHSGKYSGVCGQGTPLHNRDIAIDETNGYLYYTNGDGIYRMDLLTGTQRRKLINVDFPLGIALDLCGVAEGNKIYYSTNNGIMRANLDSSDATTLINTSGKPTDIAMDFPNFHIYWVESVFGSGKLMRADLDGNNIVTLSSGLRTPDNISLDLNSGKIYWIDTYTITTGGVTSAAFNQVRRANLDGSDIEIVDRVKQWDSLALDRVSGKLVLGGTSIGVSNDNQFRTINLIPQYFERDFNAAFTIASQSIVIDDLGDIGCNRA